MIFKLKQFDLKQTDSLQKMGSDSMLLGASLSGGYNKILDIGTGTGVLALMMAQKNPSATVYAIEPHKYSFLEAKYNFENSQFNQRLSVENTTLQNYQTQQKFDLIISNPPYYENSTLSQKKNRNSARHTIDLPIKDFYKYSANLLNEKGVLHLIFPADLKKKHIEYAKKYGLYPQKIINVIKENKKVIRNIISFSFFLNNSIQTESIIISLTNGKYSNKYIELTKDFYAHDLANK
jgi:tRNA1Val (adenine37-N6)-methyltransferase